MRDRRQVDQLARSLHLQAMDVGERAALRVLGVGEQRAGGGVRAGSSSAPKAASEATRSCLQSMRWPSALSNCQAGRRVIAGAPSALPSAGRGRSRSTITSAGASRASQPASSASVLSARPISPFDSAVQARPKRLATRLTATQDRIALLGEQVALGQRARRDDADDLALDRPLGRADLADLLADRDRFAEPDQLGEVAVDRVHRHAGHRDRLAGARAARGQGDVEQAMRALRVVEEELVEVAHPVEEERVGMLGLDAQVLLHHRRVADRLGGVHRRSRARIADGLRRRLVGRAARDVRVAARASAPAGRRSSGCRRRPRAGAGTRTRR